LGSISPEEEIDYEGTDMSRATQSLPIDAFDKDIYNSGCDATGEWGDDETAEVGVSIGRGEEGKDLDVGGEGTALG